MSFALTLKAIQKLQNYRQENPDLPYLRIRVEAGGCAGFQYVFLFERSPEADDNIIGEEAQVLIDPASQPFLEGATLDYTEELIGASFVINNPSATKSCGCQNSFTPQGF